MLAEQDFLLAGCSGVLPKLALAVEATPSAAHKDEQEKDDNPPCTTAAAPTVVVFANCSEIGKAIVVQVKHLFQIKIINRVDPAYFKNCMKSFACF